MSDLRRTPVLLAILMLAIAAFGEPAFASSTLPPGPSFEATGPVPLLTASGSEAFPLPPSSEDFAPYTEDPTEVSPYAVCPPPTETRVSCLGVGVPTPSKVGALGLPEPSYEGSGKSGGFSPADIAPPTNCRAKAAKGRPSRSRSRTTIPTPNPTWRNSAKSTNCRNAAKTAASKRSTRKAKKKTTPPSTRSGRRRASLDLDMVSAVCPKCHILLVEADNNLTGSMYAAVDRAAKLGATVISNSWEGEEYPGEEAEDHYFDYPGIPVLFASGDDGYGVEYPSASSKVIAVGGTSLKKAANARGWSESAWSGAGSGCSKYAAKPTWQKDGGCFNRTVADVAAVADPETPVSVYDTYEAPGWMLVGGTSVATPVMAGVLALSSSAVRSAGPSAFSPAGQGSELFDVTEGENALCGTYLCQAEVGYDGPTGWGTPDGPLSLPVAVTEAATVASTSKATLRGSVRPGGFATKYRFEYGETAGYGTTVPVSEKSVGSGSTYVEASEAIEGLKGQRTYHYRIVATNSQGTFYGVDRVFGTTPAAVTTAAASEVGIYQATLNGTVNPEGSRTTYYLEYGPTTSYGSHQPLSAKEVGSGTKAVAVSATIKALEGGATYHYRVVGKNTAGTSFGADKTLTTLPPEWRSQQLPQPAESAEEREAYGVSCTSPDACIAVGSQWRLGKYHTLVTFATAWDGTAWSVMSTPNPPGLEEGYKKNRYATLDGISCYSAIYCIAVGHYRGASESLAPLSLRWNGSSWEELSTPKPSGATEATLSAVSCASTASCVAVGSYVNGSGTRLALALRWNGSSWEEQAALTPAGATSSQLSGVSCSSSTLCTAVGYFQERKQRRKDPGAALERQQMGRTGDADPGGSTGRQAQQHLLRLLHRLHRGRLLPEQLSHLDPGRALERELVDPAIDPDPARRRLPERDLLCLVHGLHGRRCPPTTRPPSTTAGGPWSSAGAAPPGPSSKRPRRRCRRNGGTKPC